MNAESFVSYSQNGEDVVLMRALGHLDSGHYIEVGANHPTNESVSRAFYDRGWSGITIEPMQEYAQLHRAERPRDILVEAAISSDSGDTVVLHQIAETGLSSLVASVGEVHRESGWTVTEVTVPVRRLDQILDLAGWDGLDIQFMMIDVEGAERSVLETIDFGRWRPWVLVIEATEPLSTTSSHQSWEPMVLAAGYVFCLFDGLSRFYVSQERYEELHQALSYPACIHDNYQPRRVVELEAAQARLERDLTQLREQVSLLQPLEQERDRLEDELVHTRGQEAQAMASAVRWRQKAVHAWAQASTGSTASSADLLAARARAYALAAELDAIKQTVSWRLTAPLRSVRRGVPRRSPETMSGQSLELVSGQTIS
ncbi:MAG: FkbM family methyltransferase [Nakamurella sp.]